MIDIDEWLSWANAALYGIDRPYDLSISLVVGIEEFRQDWPSFIDPEFQQGRWR